MKQRLCWWGQIRCLRIHIGEDVVTHPLVDADLRKKFLRIWKRVSWIVWAYTEKEDESWSNEQRDLEYPWEAILSLWSHCRFCALDGASFFLAITGGQCLRVYGIISRTSLLHDWRQQDWTKRKIMIAIGGSGYNNRGHSEAQRYAAQVRLKLMDRADASAGIKLLLPEPCRGISNVVMPLVSYGCVERR